METTMIGFALGIVTFIFALMSVGMVWAVIKIKDTDESLRNLERDFTDVSNENKRDLVHYTDEMNRILDDKIDAIERELDSRLDKMYNKLTQ